MKSETPPYRAATTEQPEELETDGQDGVVDPAGGVGVVVERYVCELDEEIASTKKSTQDIWYSNIAHTLSSGHPPPSLIKWVEQTLPAKNYGF